MSEQVKRPGGRTKRTREAVFGSVLEILEADGYGGLTVEALAERSGVHKTTIYRRWGSVDNVFAATVTAIAERSVPIVVTADPTKDLVDLAQAIAANLEGPVGRATAAASIGRPGNDEFVVLVRRFWTERLSKASVLVVHGMERGEFDRALSPSAVLQEIAAQIWFRVIVMRTSVTDEDAAAIVARALTPG